MKHSALRKKIMAVPGVGPITATTIGGAIGDARQFRNGRHLAVWLGPVPRQSSSGGANLAYKYQSAWRHLSAYIVDPRGSRSAEVRDGQNRQKDTLAGLRSFST